MGIPQNYENLLVDNVRLRAEAEAKGLCKPWAPEPIGADAFTERGESGEQLNRAIVRDRRKKEKIAMVECVKSAHSRLHKYTPEELAQMDADYQERAKKEARQRRIRFDELDAGIRSHGRIVVHTLAEMLPMLDEVRQMLSRKGLYYNPYNELPKWGEYGKELAAEFKINFRTIQARLQKYRDGDRNEDREPPAPKWSLRTQHQAVKALDVAGKVIAAVKAGKPVKPLVREWDAVAFAPEVRDTLLARVDPVTEFLDGILTPYIASMLQYVRSLEDAVFYHAPTMTDDREHRVWAYKQQFYDVPPELKQVFAKARHQQPARECSQVELDGTPIGEGVRLPHPAPSSLTAGQGS